MTDAKAFNLTSPLPPGTAEVFSNVTMDSTKTNYVVAGVITEWHLPTLLDG